MALLPLLSYAYDAYINGIFYNFSSSEATVTYQNSSYNSYSGDVVIPATVTYQGKTYSVTSIGNYAFRGCSRLTSITIPNSVTSIGYEAFYGCSDLTSVTIPSSVLSIGTDAFYNATSLSNFVLEDGDKPVTIALCFYSCPLDSVYLGRNVECTTNVYKEPLPPFESKYSLRAVTVGDKVTAINSRLFSSCSNLESLDLGQGVKTIGQSAFYSSKLRHLTIPSSVTNIGRYAFNQTSALQKLSLADGNKPLFVEDHGLSFSILDTLYLGRNVKYNEQYPALSGVMKLTNLIVGETVTEMQDDMFRPINSINRVEYKSIEQMLGIKYGNHYSHPYTRALNSDNHIVGGNTLREIIIPEGYSEINPLAFYYAGYIDSLYIPSTMRTIGEIAFGGVFLTKRCTLPDQIVAIGQSALPSNIATRAGTSTLLALWESGVSAPSGTGTTRTLYRPDWDVQATTQTTVRMKMSVPKHITYPEYEFEANHTCLDEENCATVNGLRPEYSGEIDLNVSFGGRLYKVNTAKFTTAPLSVAAVVSTTASSVNISGTYIEGDANIVSQSIFMDDKEYDGKHAHVNGLDGQTEHTIYYKVGVEYGNNEVCEYIDTIYCETDSLVLTTQQPRVISDGNVIVCATSNLDDEETNVGFEWRRIDWTDDFDSRTGGAYLYEGTMEGYIRSINSNYLWRFRPYYTSNAGNTYYGEWKGMDPSDYSYFEPTVHTYASISVQGNRAEVKGYAMRGTDRVTSQGFMYWKKSSSYSLRKKAASIPSDAITVEVSGNVMTVALEDLDYETEYCYVAFVMTEENETFFGEVQTFRTSSDPDGIGEVKASEEATEIARYDIQGRKIAGPQKGINIIRMSDGTTRKVMER